MAKDARELRDEATAANAAGKYKRALAAYLELERIESRDAQWAKRAGETYRKLGNKKLAIEAFERAVERYAQNGFLVQAIAVCKIILQIDPDHAGALNRVATMNEQVGHSPTRAANYAENNPALHDNPNVAAIRRTPAATKQAVDIEFSDESGAITLDGELPEDPVTRFRTPTSAQMAIPAISVSRTRTITPPRGEDTLELGAAGRVPDPPPPSLIPQSAQQAIAVARTKSRPISLPPGMALDQVDLRQSVPQSRRRDESAPGIYMIPIDDDELGEEGGTHDYSHASLPLIEVEPPNDVVEPEVDEATELELADIEEIPLPAPRAIGTNAAKALAATPLFAGLPSEALHALVEHLELVLLEPGEILFHEGDPGDTLYVIAEGEVAVQAEGPPRVEMARLGAGSFIGEVALMTDQPRSATVTAVEPSELLRIDRITLSRVLANHGDVLRAVLRFVRARLVDRWVRTSPLFRPFEDAERREVAERFNFLEIEAGTQLIGAGERPDGLYIVLSGVFLVQRSGATIAQLGPGDLIGETALLSGGAFKSDVNAKVKGLALCLPAAAFRELIMTHPHVLEYMSEQAEHSRRLQIL